MPTAKPTERRDTDVLVDPSVTELRIRGSLLAGAALVAVALVATFGFAQLRAESVLRGQMLEEARAFTQAIVATRQFVAMHGGVFVPESKDASLNPYLAGVPGLKSRILDQEGVSYVLQNPALVTREVNQQLEKLPGVDVAFHLSSDRPVNPANLADDFERAALGAFDDRARTEYYAFVDSAGGREFRYSSPLYTQESCLLCHAYQGYKVGDVRGVISVRLGAERLQREFVTGRTLTALGLVGSLTTLLIALYFVMTRLLSSLLLAEARLRDMATLDALTGLQNRRMGLRRLADEVVRSDREGTPLAAIMFDLDHFKEVNDTSGHGVGDAMLVAVARAVTEQARQYDVVARIGGEELLVLMPGADEADAVAAAERMREAVAKASATVAGWIGSAITMSGGVAVHSPGADESSDELLVRADRALYRAKDQGRDSACTG